MFVIKENDIKDAFYPSSWEHDFNNAVEVKKVKKAIVPGPHGCYIAYLGGDKSYDEIINARNYKKAMDNAFEFIKNNIDAINGYFLMRQAMLELDMTPEDFEYGILGCVKDRVKTGKIRNMTEIRNITEFSEKNFDEIGSYGYVPQITKIVSNEPNTIIYFNDGTKTTVKCEDGSEFDPETGVYMALLKKAYGSKNLQHIFKLIKAATSETTSDISPVPEDELVPEGMETVNIDDWDNDTKTE